MFNLQKTKENLYNWVESQITSGFITGLTIDQVIFRDGNSPLPARPCIAMKIISGPNRLGTSDSIFYKSGDDFNIGGQRELTLSVQIYGNQQLFPGKAGEIASRLNASLSKLTVQDNLRAGVAGEGVVTLQDKGNVLNFTGLEETEFEERFQFDVILGAAESIEDRPYIIEQAEISRV